MGDRTTRKLFNQGNLQFFEDKDHGTNKITVQGAHELSADQTWTIPATQTLGYLRNDGAGSLTWEPNNSLLFNVKSYGAVGNGIADDTTAINNAITAASSVYGCVYFPYGTYVISTGISIPDKISLVGDGRWGSTIKYTGSSVAITFSGTVMATMRDLRLEVATSATGTAIYMAGTGGTWCQYCTLRDMEITTTSGLVSGQKGLHLDGSTNQVVYGFFSNLILMDFDSPILYGSNCEANQFNGIHINGFGAGATGTGFTVNGDNSIIAGVWLGRKSSTATLTGFAGTGEKNIIYGICDIATTYTGITATLTGVQNVVRVIAIGTGFTSGSVKSQNLALGESIDSSAFEAYVLANTGGDKQILQAGVRGFSNGFTVDYQNSAPQTLRYSFVDGPVGIGAAPAFASASPLLGIHNDSALHQALSIEQDGNTSAVYIQQDGQGAALSIQDNDSTSGTGAVLINKVAPGPNLWLGEGTNYAGIYVYNGSPEGAVVAPVGSLCLNTAGGAGTSLYVKQTGIGNTGWVGK